MSGIAGIVNLNGAPIDRTALARMEAALNDHGSDGVHSWRQGPIGLVRAHFWTTPEETGEQQPTPVAGGRYWIVSDARLDNREELIALLYPDLYTARPTDAELIVAAYRRWEETCPRRLLGDFAFAIWDTQERRLFCARDPLGVRQLHYSRQGQSLLFASTIGAIVAGLEARPALNEPLLQDLLAGRFDRWVQETPYRSIVRLQPSGALLASEAGVCTSRYYVLGEGPSISYRRDTDYVDHFRELAWRAVRARLRSSDPVALLVNGDLDSSSIACIADDLVGSGARMVPARLYSHTPDVTQREYLHTVVAGCRRLATTTLTADDCWGLHAFGDEASAEHEHPGGTPDGMLKPLRRARRDGCRVVLSGYGTDQILAREMTAAARVDAGDGAPAPCEIEPPRSWTALEDRESRTRVPASTAFLRSLLPAPLRNLGRRFTDSARRPDATLLNLLPAHSPDHLSSEAICRQLTDGRSSARMVMHHNVAALTGIEWRFPFLDRKLVEFLIGLPPRMRVGDGMTRYLLREALKGVLPERIQVREGGGTTRIRVSRHWACFRVRSRSGTGTSSEPSASKRGCVSRTRTLHPVPDSRSLIPDPRSPTPAASPSSGAG